MCALAAAPPHFILLIFKLVCILLMAKAPISTELWSCDGSYRSVPATFSHTEAAAIPFCHKFHGIIVIGSLILVHTTAQFCSSLQYVFTFTKPTKHKGKGKKTRGVSVSALPSKGARKYVE